MAVISQFGYYTAAWIRSYAWSKTLQQVMDEWMNGRHIAISAENPDGWQLVSRKLIPRSFGTRVTNRWSRQSAGLKPTPPPDENFATLIGHK